MTTLDKRMHFQGDLTAVTEYLNDLVAKHKLDAPVNKADFLKPEVDVFTLVKQVMVENMMGTESSEETMVALAQRVLWATKEITALRRSQRRQRSQINRLKKSLEKAKMPLTIYGTEEGFKQMETPNRPEPAPELLMDGGKTPRSSGTSSGAVGK